MIKYENRLNKAAAAAMKISRRAQMWCYVPEFLKLITLFIFCRIETNFFTCFQSKTQKSTIQTVSFVFNKYQIHEDPEGAYQTL